MKGGKCRPKDRGGRGPRAATAGRRNGLRPLHGEDVQVETPLRTENARAEKAAGEESHPFEVLPSGKVGVAGMNGHPDSAPPAMGVPAPLLGVLQGECTRGEFQRLSRGPGTFGGMKDDDRPDELISRGAGTLGVSGGCQLGVLVPVSCWSSAGGMPRALLPSGPGSATETKAAGRQVARSRWPLLDDRPLWRAVATIARWDLCCPFALAKGRSLVLPDSIL